MGVWQVIIDLCGEPRLIFPGHSRGRGNPDGEKKFKSTGRHHSPAFAALKNILRTMKIKIVNSIEVRMNTDLTMGSNQSAK